MALTFEIAKHIGILAKLPNGWTKEINLVSWNDRPAKYDIRDWDEEHQKMTKGITMSEDEFEELKAILIDIK